jgi:hypothetical protein
MRTVIKFMLRAAAVVALASTFSPLSFGQTAAQIEDAKRAEMERRAGENERRIADWELRMTEVRRPPERTRDSNLAYSQIREDYKQIQIVNNDLVGAIAGGALDFKYVSKSVSEIKSRAARLKMNMMLPEEKQSSFSSRLEFDAVAEQIKSALSVLDKLIIEFVNNPIFDQTKTVDVKQGVKARRNLEEIIELSEQIKKSTEKLKNIAQKTQ